MIIPTLKTRSVLHLLILIEVLRKRSQFSGQFRQNLDFSEFLKKWKMANFKSKNLCDKSLKIKNLRWQFSCLFRCLCRGTLYFCSRCRFHGEICRSKSPFLKIFKKVKKWVFLYGKIRRFFCAHLVGLSEKCILDPQTLVGDSKRWFPAMNYFKTKLPQNRLDTELGLKRLVS